MRQPASMYYRPDIDGLRAVAVLFVVIFHAFPSTLQGGFIGVDVFFVISGYLISGILLKDLESNTFSLLRFYAKRIRRIFPALILVLLASLFFGYFVLYDQEYKNLGQHVVAGSGFISNILLWQESGYFDKAAELKPLLHLWSLGIEEQFYIVWPCLLFLAWRRPFKVRSFVILFALVSFTLTVIAVRHHSAFTFYSPLMRGWELLLGAFLAYTTHQKTTADKRCSPRDEMKGWVGLFLLFLSPFVLSRTKLFPSEWALLPTFGAYLLIDAEASWVNRNILSHPWLVAIGLMSYPWYLWHWPLLAYAHIIFSNQESTWLIVVLIAVSMLLAFLTYQWVERPIRFYKTERSQSTWILGSLLLLVGMMGYMIYHTEGLPSRKMGFEELQPFDTYKKQALPCELYTKGLDSLSLCFQTQKGSPTHVLWGDSHAEHLFPGIMGEDPKTNWLVLGHTGCPPLLGVQVVKKGREDVCAQNNTKALEAILKTQSIKTVVLVSLGPFYITDKGYAAGHTGADEPINWLVVSQKNPVEKKTKAELFYQGLNDTITALEQHGKQVILYRDIPEVPFMPEDCLSRPFSPHKHPCQMAFEEAVRVRQAEYYKILQALQKTHPKLYLFDPIPYMCDEVTCYVREGDNLLYRDAHHLSLYGSQFLARPFLDWLWAQDKSHDHTTVLTQQDVESTASRV